jgi:hypothetical protein
MSKIPEDSLVIYFWFLLTTFFSVSTEKSTTVTTSGIGLKLLIQIIAKHFPNAIVKNLTPIKTSYGSSIHTIPVLLYVFNQFLTEKGARYAFSGNVPWK